MKVLVSGDRKYTNQQKVFEELDRLHSQRPIEMIVHGGETGADALAHYWAEIQKVPVRVYNADWSKYGRSAIPHRNAQMIENEMPHGMVTFTCGAGTKNLVNLAKKANIPVIERE